MKLRITASASGKLMAVLLPGRIDTQKPFEMGQMAGAIMPQDPMSAEPTFDAVPVGTYSVMLAGGMLDGTPRYALKTIDVGSGPEQTFEIRVETSEMQPLEMP